jgi:hypothetical protein
MPLVWETTVSALSGVGSWERQANPDQTMMIRMRVRADFALERELWGRGVTAVAGVDGVGCRRARRSGNRRGCDSRSWCDYQGLGRLQVAHRQAAGGHFSRSSANAPLRSVLVARRSMRWIGSTSTGRRWRLAGERSYQKTPCAETLAFRPGRSVFKISSPAFWSESRWYARWYAKIAVITSSDSIAIRQRALGL